jgi:hypothetical protein
MREAQLILALAARTTSCCISSNLISRTSSSTSCQNIQARIDRLTSPDLFTSFELLYPRFITRHHKARRITSSPGSALPSSSLRFPPDAFLACCLLHSWLGSLTSNATCILLLPLCPHYCLGGGAIDGSSTEPWPDLPWRTPNQILHPTAHCAVWLLFSDKFTLPTWLKVPAFVENQMEFFSMHCSSMLKWSWLFLHLSRFYFLESICNIFFWIKNFKTVLGPSAPENYDSPEDCNSRGGIVLFTGIHIVWHATPFCWPLPVPSRTVCTGEKLLAWRLYVSFRVIIVRTVTHVLCMPMRSVVVNLDI